MITTGMKSSKYLALAYNEILNWNEHVNEYPNDLNGPFTQQYIKLYQI